MLPAGKAACFLLVMAVFAAACLDRSVTVSGNRICTEQDKKDVLVNCKLNIKNGKFTPPAPKTGVCCQVVRHMQSKDSKMMDCVVEILTDDEKRERSAVKMMELVGRCVVPAHQVMFVDCTAYILFHVLLLHNMDGCAIRYKKY